MDEYKRILVATDFSDINRPAVERAAMLARQDNSELILLHVIEHFPYDAPLFSAMPQNLRPDDILIQQVHGKMNELLTTLKLPEAQPEIRITMKSARHEILRYAKAHDVDLIVVAPHGHGVIGALGSTAIGVLNGATCDVLSVREVDGHS
jgi:universal stress protein A